MRGSAVHKNHNSLLHSLRVIALCYFSYLSFVQSITCTWRVAPFFQDQSPGKGGVGEMQNRPYSLYPFCAVKPHSFIYSLSSPCVLMGWSLSICRFVLIVASGKSVSLLLHMCTYFFMLFLCRRAILGRVLY